jgi:hypothetical protein
MDPNEIIEELDHAGARNLLASATLLRLAYNGSDGFPRVIPIGFYWNGNQIVVCTAAMRATLPIRRVVGPADVVALAVHIMTNTALNGATYDIDGGQPLTA